VSRIHGTAIVGAFLCLSSIRHATAKEAIAVHEHPSVSVQVLGIPEECLVGEVLDLTVVMRNKTDKPQVALAPEHVVLSWVRIAEDGKPRPLPGGAAYRGGWDPLEMSSFEVRTAAQQIQMPIVPYRGQTPVTGGDLGIKVWAGYDGLVTPQRKIVRKACALGMVLPTAISDYKVLRVMHKVRHNRSHVFEVTEVATKPSQYLVLRRVREGNPERISALFRLACYRDKSGNCTAAEPIITRDRSFIASAWVYRTDAGHRLGWRVLRDTPMGFKYWSSGELLLPHVVTGLAIREADGELHITGKSAGAQGTVGIAVPTTVPLVSGVAPQGVSGDSR